MVNHPQVRLAFVHSTSNAGNRIADVHGGLEGDTELRFADTCDLASIDVLLLCSAHGEKMCIRDRSRWAPYVMFFKNKFKKLFHLK